MPPRLRCKQITLDESKVFVERIHRHHRPSKGHKYSLACCKAPGWDVVGVAMCGRPINRYLDDGTTIEVNRVATDGTKNACSSLYGAARRVAWALGYTRIVTYTLETEPGSSLKAAGYTQDGTTDGGEWGKTDLTYENANDWPTMKKTRWVCERDKEPVTPAFPQEVDPNWRPETDITRF